MKNAPFLSLFRKNSRFLFSLFLITCLLLFSAFPSTAQAQQETDGRESSGSPETESSLQEKPYAEIIDSYNRHVIIENKPRRIISLGPNLTETIFALGKGENLAGRTDYCDYPEDVHEVPSVGSIMDPSIEKMIELEPDLILASAHVGREVVDAAEKAGLTMVCLYADTNLSGAYTIIEETGRLLGAEEKADEIIGSMQKQISDIREMTKGMEKPTVYYVVDYGEWGDFTAGGDTFIHQLITLAGGMNAAADVTGWSYSMEKLIEDDPDLLICSQYFNTKEQLLQTPGYRDLPAVKAGRLYEIDNNLLDRQGPRNAEAVKRLAEIFYPDLFSADGTSPSSRNEADLQQKDAGIP